MNRRSFIKTVTVASTTLPLTSSLGEDRVETLTGTTLSPSHYRWDYRVYCYEREQGEWVFSENIKGSFAPEREYMTHEEEQATPYTGWMDGGKLHFVTLEEAQDFVEMHVRAKDDTNLIDHIYDIYYVSRELDEKEVSSGEYKETEIKVAHYWFNGDTGRQINWVAQKPYTDYSRVELS